MQRPCGETVPSTKLAASKEAEPPLHSGHVSTPASPLLRSPLRYVSEQSHATG